ncbi:MAG: cell division protein ZapA [Holosporales bacterium]|jgi:cell division protein ZapA
MLTTILRLLVPPLEIAINGRPYTVACEAGQEQRLHQISAELSVRAKQISDALGILPDSKLFLLLTLMLMDEHMDEKQRLVERVQRRREAVEATLADDIRTVSGRIVSLAGRVKSLAERVAA